MDKNVPKLSLPSRSPASSHKHTHRRSHRSKKLRAYGKAHYPAYETKAARLATFTNWPKPEVVDPEELATAGFFYFNDSDRVRCFVCGCALHNWDREFSPKDEHKGWFPHCNYARLLIENPRALVEVSSHPAVRAVVDLGYSSSEVEETFDHLTHSGCQSPHASDLLDVLWSRQQSNAPPEEPTEHEEDDLYSAGACALPTCNHNGLDESDSEEEDDTPEMEVDIKKAHHEQAEDARLRQQVAQLEQLGRCRGCQDKKADTVNLPCGHLATCQACVYKYNRCRICNTLIQGIVKVYMV